MRVHDGAGCTTRRQAVSGTACPSYDSGWVPVEAGTDLFPIPHPLGNDIFSALIAAESRSPGFTEFSPTFWSSNENEVKVDRGLFSQREVRVRIWVHR